MAATTRLGALLLVLAMALTTSLLVALAVTGPQARPAQAQTALPQPFPVRNYQHWIRAP